MILTEPMTMVTDYVLAASSVLFALRLRGGRRTVLWVAAFLVTALAAVLGGTAHGFRVPLGETRTLVWSATVWSIAASSALLIAAGVRSAIRPATRDERARREGHRWLKRAVAITLVGLAVLVGGVSPHQHFNHNDLYHVIQMAGLYGLYRGAACLDDGQPGGSSVIEADR